MASTHPAANAASNKAKIACRVVEVLEYFDDTHPTATVMDIVRRYNRPQSSTSELLSSLVELGLLHKDRDARSYSLTARAALIGAAGQPEPVRDGRLVRLVDRLQAQTGLAVALFGMVAQRAQVLLVRHGTRPSGQVANDLFGGAQASLAETAGGLLLLSTLPRARCEAVLRRLNADAAEGAGFVHRDMMARIDQCREQRFCQGPLGFGLAATAVATLVPGQADDRPLAVALIHQGESHVQSPRLRDCVLAAADASIPAASSASIERLSTAA